MRLLVITLLLVAFAALSAGAADVEINAQKVEVNGLFGTVGAAGGIFWPAIQVPKFDIRLGPMGAVGENTVLAGGGIEIPVAIDAPILENLNFGWAGYGYNWEDHDWGMEFGVGTVMEIK